VDRELTRLACWVCLVSNPLAMPEVDSLLDQRLTLMAQRDTGWTTRNRRPWRR
jgi:hypothetical protein